MDINIKLDQEGRERTFAEIRCGAVTGLLVQATCQTVSVTGELLREKVWSVMACEALRVLIVTQSCQSIKEENYIPSLIHIQSFAEVENTVEAQILRTTGSLAGKRDGRLLFSWCVCMSVQAHVCRS